jgi:hypothetical protein
LTSATHLQRGLDAVIAKTAAPSGGKYLARPTLSGKSSPDFLISSDHTSSRIRQKKSGPLLLGD